MPKRLPADTYERIMSAVRESLRPEEILNQIRKILDDDDFDDFDLDSDLHWSHQNIPFSLYTGDTLHVNLTIDFHFKEKVTDGWRRKHGFIP